MKANVWVAARNLAQPIILSVGTIFATISLDKQPLPDISFLKESSRPRGRPRREDSKLEETEDVTKEKKERKKRKQHEFRKYKRD